jgi:hypothetical protein
MRITALLKGLQFISVPHDDILKAFVPLKRAGWKILHNRGRATQFFKVVALQDSKKVMVVVEPDKITIQAPQGKQSRWKFPGQLPKALKALEGLIAQQLLVSST